MDWQNIFAIEVLYNVFYYYWGDECRLLHLRLRYTRYVVICYVVKWFFSGFVGESQPSTVGNTHQFYHVTVLWMPFSIKESHKSLINSLYYTKQWHLFVSFFVFCFLLLFFKYCILSIEIYSLQSRQSSLARQRSHVRTMSDHNMPCEHNKCSNHTIKCRLSDQ